jgi:hypothetical protein
MRGFDGQLCGNKVIGCGNQLLEFPHRKRVQRIQPHPFVAPNVRGWGQALALHEFRKGFRSALKAKAWAGVKVQRCHHKHLVHHFEAKIIAPLNVLCGFGKGKAIGAERFNIHGRLSVRSRDFRRPLIGGSQAQHRRVSSVRSGDLQADG